jgi:CheY-like chemotaxis protein
MAVGPSPDLGRLNVLVVDDDTLILFNAVDMLEELGCVVTQATSGKEAMSLLESGKFDLVITDHAMPRMTGAELMLKIKKLHPAMPIILATGYADLPATSGVDNIRLPKPYTLCDLAAALVRVSREHGLPHRV